MKNLGANRAAPSLEVNRILAFQSGTFGLVADLLTLITTETTDAIVNNPTLTRQILLASA
jgi:hypothetical protein